MSGASVPDLFESAATRGEPRGATHVWQTAVARAALPEVVTAPHRIGRGRALVAAAAAALVVVAGVGVVRWEDGRHVGPTASTTDTLHLLPAALPAGWSIVGRLDVDGPAPGDHLADVVVLAADDDPSATIVVSTSDGSTRGTLFQWVAEPAEEVIVADLPARFVAMSGSGLPADLVVFDTRGGEVRVAGRGVARPVLLAAAGQVVAAVLADRPLAVDGFAPRYAGADRSGFTQPVAHEEIVLADDQGEVARIFVVADATLEPDALTWRLDDPSVSTTAGNPVVTGTLRGEPLVVTQRAGATVEVTSDRVGVDDLVDVVAGLVTVDRAEWEAVPQIGTTGPPPEGG